MTQKKKSRLTQKKKKITKKKKQNFLKIVSKVTCN